MDTKRAYSETFKAPCYRIMEKIQNYEGNEEHFLRTQEVTDNLVYTVLPEYLIEKPLRLRGDPRKVKKVEFLFQSHCCLGQCRYMWNVGLAYSAMCVCLEEDTVSRFKFRCEVCRDLRHKLQI